MSTIANEHQVISSLLASPIQKMSSALDPLFSSVNMGLNSVPSPASSPEPAAMDQAAAGGSEAFSAVSSSAEAELQMKYEPYIDIESVRTRLVALHLVDLHVGHVLFFSFQNLQTKKFAKVNNRIRKMK